MFVLVQIKTRTYYVDYKSGDFHLKRYYIEYTSPKIKHCPIEFDIVSIKKDTNCTYCTPLISPNATNKTLLCVN